MIRSMTGFGQASRSYNGYKFQVDVKSVNHRYCEIMIRMPKEWMFLEDGVRKKIQQSVKRGRVDAFLSIEKETGADKTVEVNWSLLEGYRQAAEQVKRRLGLSDSLSLKELLSIPDLIRFDDNETDSREWIENELGKCVEDAVVQLVQMRQTEGRHLHSDLQERLQVIERMRHSVVQAAPTVVQEYGQKLKQRIEELLSDQFVVDEQRLAVEVAIFADRSNIDEELTRLDSHLQQCRLLLGQSEPVGRKLDFLIQEMNREVNTIGSKANHTEIVASVVELKAELEKLREQAQNIE